MIAYRFTNKIGVRWVLCSIILAHISYFIVSKGNDLQINAISHAGVRSNQYLNNNSTKWYQPYKVVPPSYKWVKTRPFKNSDLRTMTGISHSYKTTWLSRWPYLLHNKDTGRFLVRSPRISMPLSTWGSLYLPCEGTHSRRQLVHQEASQSVRKPILIRGVYHEMATVNHQKDAQFTLKLLFIGVR